MAEISLESATAFISSRLSMTVLLSNEAWRQVSGGKQATLSNGGLNCNAQLCFGFLLLNCFDVVIALESYSWIESFREWFHEFVCSL